MAEETAALALLVGVLRSILLALQATPETTGQRVLLAMLEH